MAGGYSNREIAEALGTRGGTVKNHAVGIEILSKLGVRDRTRGASTRWSFRRGHTRTSDRT